MNSGITLSALVDSVKIDLKVTSDDHYLAQLDEFIEDKIHAARKQLIHDQYRSERKIDPAFFQRLNCIEISCIEDECTIGGVVIRDHNNQIRSATLPTLINSVDGKEFFFVGVNDFSRKFTHKSFDGFIYTNYNKYTSNNPCWTNYANLILLKNVPKGMIILGLIVLLYKPNQVCGWLSTDSYPVPSEAKLLLLVKKDLVSTWNIPYDEKNDSRATIILPKTAFQNEPSE